MHWLPCFFQFSLFILSWSLFDHGTMALRTRHPRRLGHADPPLLTCSTWSREQRATTPHFLDSFHSFFLPISYTFTTLPFALDAQDASSSSLVTHPPLFPSSPCPWVHVMLCWSWTHPHVWTTDIDPFIMKCVGSCLFTLQTSGEDQDFTQPVQKDEGLDTYTWWRTLKTLPSRSFFLELPGLNRPCPCVMALPVMHPLDLPNLGFRSSALSFGRGMVPKLGLDGHDKGGSVIDPLPSRPPSSCLLPLSLLPTPFWWLDPLWTTTSDLPNERGIPVVNERAQKLPLNALRSPFLIPLNASFRHQVIQAAHFAAAAYDKNQTRLTSWQCEKW
ncbi:hypothetical protein HMI56_005612 [Coelomomyces lativittatus]|nr:hypothetical protein HMI56_005612 [Coelomomyces lativittatus]